MPIVDDMVVDLGMFFWVVTLLGYVRCCDFMLRLRERDAGMLQWKKICLKTSSR